MTSRIASVPRTNASAPWALAALLSSLALVWRSRRDTGRPAAAVNAVSHWLWPEKALRVDDGSLRYTGTGTVVHVMSSLLWAALYGWWMKAGRGHGPLNAAAKAAAVTSVAAVVDLRVVPGRLSPGFEHRLSPQSVAVVYASFALGLALGGLMLRRIS